MAQLATTPIAVAQQAAGGTTVVASEGVDGLYVRADDFVYRMSAHDTATVTLRASRFGQPLPNAACSLAFDASQLQQGDGPTVGGPPAGLTFPASVTTDAQGVASFQLSAGSIGKPRDYNDGHVQGCRHPSEGEPRPRAPGRSQRRCSSTARSMASARDVTESFW